MDRKRLPAEQGAEQSGAVQPGDPAPGTEAGKGGEASGPGDAGAAAPEERFGPLTLRRLRKEDGRALIVFEHPGR